MERIIDVLPIILLGIGQFLQATVIMDLSKRARNLQERHDMIMEALYETLMEVNHGDQG